MSTGREDFLQKAHTYRKLQDDGSPYLSGTNLLVALGMWCIEFVSLRNRFVLSSTFRTTMAKRWVSSNLIFWLTLSDADADMGDNTLDCHLSNADVFVTQYGTEAGTEGTIYEGVGEKDSTGANASASWR